MGKATLAVRCWLMMVFDPRLASFAILVTALGNAEADTQNAGSSGWNYEASQDWGKYHKECGGEQQSPINIDPATAVNGNYPPFVFTNYDQIIPTNITNNGHSVLLHLPANYPVQKLPSISGGGLPDKYSFAQLHFHWGSDARKGGSEHVIRSRRYPAELHLVHFKEAYGNLSEAIKYKDGLAVLGIFMDLERSGNVAFRHFVDLFNRIRTEGVETSIPSPIPLMDLLPDSVDDFYRYQGSLTTPGCQEIVTWTVFDTPIALSESQFQKFGLLLGEDGQVLQNNFRSVVPLNGRTVSYRSANGQPLRPQLSLLPQRSKGR